MHWSDSSIILSAKKYGENSALLRILSEQNGVYGGVMRGIHSKTNRGIIQAGNIVGATWQARLSEQLGTLKCELLQANAAQIMQDGGKLTALTSACSLIESALPERHPYPHLYAVFTAFLNILIESESWPEAYVQFELELLAETGFGLDLTNCAVTGSSRDLIYVSPKSGRAASRSAGEPYKDKLLLLPPFLRHPQLDRGSKANNADSDCNPSPPLKAGVTAKEILDGMQLTGYFLDHWLLKPHNRKLPAARQRLVQHVSKAKELDAT